MTNEQFWEIIGTCDGPGEERGAQLEAALSALAPDEIVAFQTLFDHYHDQAYRWDLWGAAYVIGGGCSDDAFMDFRSWLISSGRKVYEDALADPESLADIEIGEDPEEDAFLEEFAYAASTAYENVSGKEMPFPERNSPVDPSGDPWEEEGDDLARRFPKLSAKYIY